MREVSFLLILSLLCLAPAIAQSPNATINGIVLDPSGAAIAGAQIVVVNDATGVQYTTKTNGEGIYGVPNLPPGAYRIQASNSGFKTIIKPDIRIHIQDALAINFTLPIGAASEIVTVQGGAPLLNTENAAVGTVVDRAYVENMPLNGRSFQDLILLTPGIVTQSPQYGNSSPVRGAQGEFSVNGQRQESNYYTVDGVSANVGMDTGFSTIQRAGPSGSVAAGTALGTTQALVSVDDLQEFRVQSSSYSAEYGRNPGGQFAFETKSGTNQWHGTAYDYLRNGAFDSLDWFNNYFGVKQPALRQNDFGGTLGGPVQIPGLYNGKNKTFFFVSYEGLRLVAPQAAVASPVPDLCMRGMGACPPGRNPAASALQPVINAFPLPSSNGLEDATNGVGQFIGSWSNPSSLDSTSVRFDHNFNDKLRLFFRFSDTPSHSATRRPTTTVPPTFNRTSSYILRTYTLGASNVLTGDLNNDFRLNYSSNEATGRQVISPFGGSSPVNLSQLTGLGPGSSPLVQLVLGSSSLVISQGQTQGTQSQWNLIDTVSSSLGRHQVKVGVDFRRLAPTGPQPGFSPQYFFFSESAVESNKGSFIGIANAPPYLLFRNFSAFAQDEWKLSHRLTLSLGLRWDVNPAPGVTKGLKPYTIQGAGPDTWTLAPQGTPLWRTTWYNFAPRLGVGYLLSNTPGRETVARGGGGVFFDTGQQLGSIGFIGPGFREFTAFLPGSFPGNPAGLVPPIVNPPIPPFFFVPAPAPHLQLPYTLQWNASVEQALGKSQALTVSYVGSHAGRLLQLNEFTSSVNPVSPDFFIAQNGSTSDYDSLQVQLQRSLSRELTALASYTLSHCIDYGSLNYKYGYQRGNCDFDVRHNFSGAFSYNLPNVGRSAIAKAVLDHWGLDDRFTVRTAFPVSLNGRTLVQPNGQSYFAGLNLVPGQPLYVYGANCDSVLQVLQNLKPGQTCPGGRAINPLAFSNVSAGFGNAPRNFARGFGAW